MTSPIPAVGIPGVAPTTGPAASVRSGDKTALDPQAFLQLLVAQLKYQDPSSPVDTSAFMQQTATLSQVQTMTTMSTTLTALMNAQQAQSAIDMIGKDVTYTDPAGAKITGLVSGAAVGATGATLTVGGASVAMSSIVAVTAHSPGTTP